MGTTKLPGINEYKWELYNVAEDYSQANDLAAKNPDKLKELQALFLTEAAKYQVLPLDNSILPRITTPRPSATAGRTEFTYKGVNPGIPDANAPSILNKDYKITAEITVPQGGAEGMPVISQPSPFFNNNTNGIGDITQEFFFTPTHPGPLIWGLGPVFTVPSATDPILGTGKVLLGPTAVALVTPGHWVIGVLVNNQWSVGGNPLRPPVNAFLAQPFVNYNMHPVASAHTGSQGASDRSETPLSVSPPRS